MDIYKISSKSRIKRRSRSFYANSRSCGTAKYRGSLPQLNDSQFYPDEFEGHDTQKKEVFYENIDAMQKNTFKFYVNCPLIDLIYLINVVQFIKFAT